MGNIDTLAIANFFGKELIGQNITIDKASSLNNLRPYSMAFIAKNNIKEPLDKNILYLIGVDKQIDKNSLASYIRVQNPRLAFAKAIERFFIKESSNSIDKLAYIGNNVKIAKNVSIGRYSIIGDDVEIGENTVIRNNVTIHSNTIIGKNSLIKSGVVLGEDGFGFDFEEDGTPIKLPHLGRVLIGDYVEIGANTVIAKGTLDDTIIENYVKIDALVHIAHNCRIGEKSMIIALSQISGSVIIGKKSWISPSSTIIQKRIIGDNVKVGIGSVVISDILDNKTVMGLDAIEAIDVFRFKKKNSYGNNKLKDKNE